MNVERRDFGDGASVTAALARDGIAWLRAPEIAALAERDPWEAAARLLGERARLVERQPIRAVPGGGSFASGSMPAPFHSDSQLAAGVPPHVQIMACHAAAASGGESLYLDTWALLERVEREAPGLFALLFTAQRRFSFVFGDVYGPSVALRAGSLVFTHSAQPSDDPVARALAPWLAAQPAIEIAATAGDVIAIHNHRMLHGRRGFEDVRRRFTRILAWRAVEWPTPGPWRERAQATAQTLSAQLRDAPPAVRAAFGCAESTGGDGLGRVGIVLELLRGVPAGLLAARERIPEPALYRWRDAVLAAAERALASDVPEDAAAWLARLDGGPGRTRTFD